MPVAGSTKLFDGVFNPKHDVLLAFLPLAHILEQVSEDPGPKLSFSS